MKNYNKDFDQDIFKAINRLGIQETKELLINFVNDTGFSLDGKTGLILSAFIEYHNRRPEGRDELETISNFINYAMYRGLRRKKRNCNNSIP